MWMETELAAASSLLPCKPRRLNLSHHTWQQMFYPLSQPTDFYRLLICKYHINGPNKIFVSLRNSSRQASIICMALDLVPLPKSLYAMSG